MHMRPGRGIGARSFALMRRLIVARYGRSVLRIPARLQVGNGLQPELHIMRPSIAAQLDQPVAFIRLQIRVAGDVLAAVTKAHAGII